jgi:hypothetical protein
MKHESGDKPDEEGCQHECKWKADNNILSIEDLRINIFRHNRVLYLQRGYRKGKNKTEASLCPPLHNINGEKRIQYFTTVQ